jgi:hypothetical protein
MQGRIAGAARTPMLNEPMQCAFETALLAIESSVVVGLRFATFWNGGQAAVDEAQQMVTEKMLAGAQAALSFGAGASAREVVSDYRAVVHANHLRLAHP